MEEEGASGTGANLSFPVLAGDDLNRVAQTILHLFSPSVSSDPGAARGLQEELQRIQSSTEAWGLIAGLAGHDDANVRFFSAHTAQVKISRDWDTLPTELQPALLRLLLETLSESLNPSNPRSHQGGNTIVIRKLFGSLASLLLRIPPHLFPHPLMTVLHAIQSSAASSAPLPPSMPGSGYSTPNPLSHDQSPFWGSEDGQKLGHRMRLWSLEWLAICVEELSRAAIGEQKAHALRRHVESDMEAVMSTITACVVPPTTAEQGKEAEAACRCAESWVTYGIGADELTAMLPHLYRLLPHPAASSALVEVLSESIFKFGKGTKILTEPLIAWFTGPAFQAVMTNADGDPSDEIAALTKLLAALVEHSSEWLIAKIGSPDVQSLLGIILRLTAWEGTGSVDEQISEASFPLSSRYALQVLIRQLTLPIYPMVQEAIMDSEMFQSPYDSDPNWAIAKSFFRELVSVTRNKVRWPGAGESDGQLGGLAKDDRESFESWRRDAGEVIVGAYYILRDEMLADLTRTAGEQVQGNAPWQDIEATLHCVRYSSEAVPLGEENYLPVLFGDSILGQLAQRPLNGKGEERLRLTVVCMIQAYEEWFKFHPTHLLPVLSYLVPSLSSTHAISRSAADALKALCDMCRKKLVEHIGAFSELHGKIGDLGPDEQVKVVQGITSVIQALNPVDAVDPVIGIMEPIVYRLNQAISASRSDPANTQPALVQSLNALTACFKGLSPSDDEMWDLTEDEEDVARRNEGIRQAREHNPRVRELRASIETALSILVGVWNGDGEVADSISSLVKHSTMSSDTLIALSPLPLLRLVTDACDSSPSALWISLASTLTLRINSPPSPLTQKRDKTPAEEEQHQREEAERWEYVADVAARLVTIAGRLIGGQGGVGEYPDVVEAWFKFSSAVASRFPGVLLRLSDEVVHGYMSLGIIGLSAQERFSLKTATEFFVALLSTTRYPSPLEPAVETLLKHFGPQVLRAILLSAGSEGPRSVIPNLAELLATFVTRVNGVEMGQWLNAILAEDGFPSAKATGEAKANLKAAILRSRTTRKMREALHDFALVARGLDGTVYGNATGV